MTPPFVQCSVGGQNGNNIFDNQGIRNFVVVCLAFHSWRAPRLDNWCRLHGGIDCLVCGRNVGTCGEVSKNRSLRPMNGSAFTVGKNILLEWRSPDPVVWRALLVKVGALPDSKYDPKLGQWMMPATPFHAKRLLDILPEGVVATIDIIQLANECDLLLAWDVLGESTAAPSWLRPYQISAVNFVQELEFRAVIADDVGLGKTIEALGAIWLHGVTPPRTLVVAPANVIYKWEREIRDPLRRFPWSGKWTAQVVPSKSTPIENVSFLVMSYDIMRSRVDELLRLGVGLLILDEVHYIKNYRALRTKAAEKLGAEIPAIVGLTGTPLLNDRPIEMWPWLSLTRPTEWPDLWGRQGYGNRYCGGRTHYGTFQDATNLDELAERLKTCTIRRTKTEVLKDLPPISIVPMPVKIPLTDYRKVERNVREAILALNPSSKGYWIHVLDRMNYLRSAVGKAKLGAAIEWATDFLESQPPLVKLVIYAHHKDVVKKLVEGLGYFTGVLVIDGRTKAKDRDVISQLFQADDEHRVIVISAAGGVGIDLFGVRGVEASNILFVELEWRPSDLVQAMGRLHRLGQSSAVTAWIMGALGTIDEYMMARVEAKDFTIAKVTDDENMMQGILEGWR